MGCVRVAWAEADGLRQLQWHEVWLSRKLSLVSSIRACVGEVVVGGPCCTPVTRELGMEGYDVSGYGLP